VGKELPVGGWVGSGVGLDAVEKSRILHFRELNLVRQMSKANTYFVQFFSVKITVFWDVPPCNLNVHAPVQDKIDYMEASFCEELEHVFDKFPKYHLKILLRDCNAKVSRKDIFKPTVGNKSLHEISNDNGVMNFSTSKNLIMFQHHSIHKFTWTSPDRMTSNEIIIF
jgi:hypothetical protein